MGRWSRHVSHLIHRLFSPVIILLVCEFLLFSLAFTDSLHKPDPPLGSGHD